jgi:hypothetical protein
MSALAVTLVIAVIAKVQPVPPAGITEVALPVPTVYPEPAVNNSNVATADPERVSTLQVAPEPVVVMVKISPT